LNDIPEEPSPNLQEHPIPIDNSRATHMTAI
jgi:phosphopantetheine adenylyltransferase